VKTLPIFLALLVSGQLGAFAQQTPEAGPPTSGDLQELVGTLQKIVDQTIGSQQGEKLSLQLESMRIPEYQSWLPAAFGSDNGPKLAALYSEGAREEERRLMEFLWRAENLADDLRQDSRQAVLINKRLNFSRHLTKRFAIR
jgi:hypothetical protein